MEKYITAYFIDTSHRSVKGDELHVDLINNGTVRVMTPPPPAKNRQHLKPKSLESSANRAREGEMKHWRKR